MVMNLRFEENVQLFLIEFYQLNTFTDTVTTSIVAAPVMWVCAVSGDR